MRYIKLIYFIICFIFTPCVLAQTTPNNNLDQIVQQSVNTWMTNQQVPGVAIAIYYQGQDHFYNFGVANKNTQQAITQNTIFELASVTKSFTATLLGICVEQGKCHLNDPVIQYLPALASTHNLPIDQVTLQDLATHTASFPRMPEDFGVTDVHAPDANANLMHQLTQWQPDYPIGTQYAYSNIGFGLLGEAVSNALGEDYSSAVQQYIFQPLGMSSTEVTVPADLQARYAQGYNNEGNPAPRYAPATWPGGGALRSTSADMLQYLKANLDANLNTANSQIPAQLSAAMQLTQKGAFQVNPHFMQALAWQRNMRNTVLVINKNGENIGFNTYIAILPQQNIAIVVLDNKRGSKPGKVAHAILQQLVTGI